MRSFIDLCEGYLTELNGFRHTDEFKGVQRMSANLNKTGNAPKDMLARGAVMAAYMKDLETKGYQRVGVGGHSCMMTHPGIEYGVKIFEGDPAYLAFVKYALAHQDNPHFPKFRGKFLDLQNGFYAVRVELLTPLDDDLRLEIADATDAYGMREAYPEELVQYASLFKQFPHMEDAMAGIIDVCRKTGSRLDLTGMSNMMGRDGFPVFIDPVAVRAGR